jgi:hypothetical protein
MGFPKDDKRQLPHQGALLCQDWLGPRRSQGPVPQDYYFAGEDLSSDTNLLGLISFFFACYGAGTPLLDEFAQQAFKDKRVEIAAQPFLASLPRRMLSLPKGGALAVVGHVERAWGHSFFWGKNRSLTTFESALLSLMNGYPIGYAFECFNERYAEISTELTDVLGEVQFGLNVEPLELASKWTANNDSKNYIVIGDPAVRMMVAENAADSLHQRPSITISSRPAGQSGDGAAPAAPAVMKTPEAKKEESQPQVKTTTQAVETAAPVQFGPVETVQPGPAQPSTAQEVLKKLAAFLAQAIDSAATLEVRTYTSDQVNQVALDPKGQLTGGNLRALTVIKILGDIEQVVPMQDGAIDHELWNIHQETVRQAQASRNELIQAAMSAAASLANQRAGR